MEHVVFFPGPDGLPAFRRLGSLADAAGFIEHLRNDENVSAVSLHALTEVPLEFRAYYRVDLSVRAAGSVVAEDASTTDEAALHGAAPIEVAPSAVTPAPLAPPVPAAVAGEIGPGRAPSAPEIVVPGPRPAAGDVGAEAAVDPGHNEADRPTRVVGEIGFFAS